MSSFFIGPQLCRKTVERREKRVLCIPFYCEIQNILQYRDVWDFPRSCPVGAGALREGNPT